MNIKLLGIFIAVILTMNMLAQEEDKMIKLPGKYDVNDIPGESFYLNDRLMDAPSGREFKQKKELYKWLANWFLSDELFSYGITLSWNNIKSMRRRVDGLHSAVEGEQLNDDLETFMGSLFGFRGGWFLSWRFTEHFGFQPEINYKVNNSNKDWKNIPKVDLGISKINNKLSIDYHLHYLEVPLVLKYNLKVSKNLRHHISLGIAVNIYLQGTSKWSYWENASYYESPMETSGKIDLDELNRFSFNLISGAGLEGRRFILDLNYIYGITSINAPHFSNEIFISGNMLEDFLRKSWEYKQHNLTFTLGYKFSGSKHQTEHKRLRRYR